jgi:hypothetical protein
MQHPQLCDLPEYDGPYPTGGLVLCDPAGRNTYCPTLGTVVREEDSDVIVAIDLDERRFDLSEIRPADPLTLETWRLMVTSYRALEEQFEDLGHHYNAHYRAGKLKVTTHEEMDLETKAA